MCERSAASAVGIPASAVTPYSSQDWPVGDGSISGSPECVGLADARDVSCDQAVAGGLPFGSVAVVKIGWGVLHIEHLVDAGSAAKVSTSARTRGPSAHSILV